jgi:hypothetical protein
MNRKTVLDVLVRLFGGAMVLCSFFGGVLTIVDAVHAGTSAGPAASHGAAPAQQAGSSTNPCPRFQPGSEVTQGPDLYSHDGVLEVDLNY